ncbi:hypothetical protein JOD43_002727 [Pullulanibacillus pueri]|nr:hypothetical protein [Pullulanibacillus pueri]
MRRKGSRTLTLFGAKQPLRQNTPPSVGTASASSRTLHPTGAPKKRFLFFRGGLGVFRRVLFPQESTYSAYAHEEDLT